MRYLIFSLVVLLTACGQRPAEEIIVGKWSYDHVDFKATANNEAISDYDREKIAEAAVEIKSMDLEFFKDKTYDLKIVWDNTDETTHGTYAIEGDGKYISTTKKDKYGSETTERSEIVRITDDSLTLISTKGTYIVYAKVKD